MDRRRLVVIHANPRIDHQVTYAEALRAGFRGLGFNALVTDDRSLRGEINVIDGPNWALSEFVGEPNVLMLDRAFWGDPHYVSMGWLQPDGGRNFHADLTPQRYYDTGPGLWPAKSEGEIGLLLDFGQVPPAGYERLVDCVRAHPAQAPGQEPLDAFLGRCRKVIGWRSTALVEAMFQGCRLEVRDHRNPLYGMTDRVDMAAKLANSQWSLAEIGRGAFWPQLSAGVTEGWPVGNLADGGHSHETVSRNRPDD